jgi:hypothetical protein
MAIVLENKNFIKSHVESTCLIADDHVHVHAGDGALFEHPSMAVIWSGVKATPSQDDTREVVRITEITTDNLTVTRAQEGTSAKEWPADSNFAHVLTAGKIDEIEANFTTPNIVIPGGVGSPTYDDMQDFLRMTRSAGRITGGTVTAYLAPPTADGKVSITAMEGMIFTTNALGGDYIYFKQAAGSVDLTGLADNTVYWIYFDWNGGAPRYVATATRSTINEYNQFTVGRVWRSGNSVEVIATGHNLYDKDRRSHNRLILKYGNMDHSSGGVLSQHATALRIQTDAGYWYVANKDFTTPAANTFFVWYRTEGGAWTKSAALTLFSDVFDGGTSKVYEQYQNGTSLGALTANKYGVYWVFLCPEGNLYVVLGTAAYSNIGAAQAAAVPASLPPYCINWARLIGKVICKNTAAALYSVETIFATSFVMSAATDHSSLANLSADDHPQYILVAGTRAFTGNQAMGGFKLTGLAAGSANGDSVRFEQLPATAYTTTFANANLTAGVLTVTHNFNNQYVGEVVITDNNSKVVIPDEVTYTNTTTLAVDLSSYGAIAGTWRVVVFNTGTSVAADAVSDIGFAASWDTVTTIAPSKNAVYDVITQNRLPRSYLAGLGLANDTDAAHDIVIAVGTCRDSANAYDMTLAAVLTKRLDAEWAAGDDAGGIFTGSVGNTTWYHVFLIRKDSDGTIDAGFDTSITAANKPAGYSNYRRLGSVLTDGSANILPFFQVGDEFRWVTGIKDVTTTNPGTNAVTRVLSTPLGVRTLAIIYAGQTNTGGTGILIFLISSMDQADTSPVWNTISCGVYANNSVMMQMTVLTDTSSQVRSRLNTSGATDDFHITTIGYVDYRGRND